MLVKTDYKLRNDTKVGSPAADCEEQVRVLGRTGEEGPAVCDDYGGLRSRSGSAFVERIGRTSETLSSAKPCCPERKPKPPPSVRLQVGQYAKARAMRAVK